MSALKRRYKIRDKKSQQITVGVKNFRE